jgi:hypothetical protein
MKYRAFTLVETVIVVAATAFITLTLGFLIQYFYKTNSYTLEQSIAVQEARTGVEDAMGYLREASYGSDGSYPIASVGTSSVTFYADTKNDGIVERITYTLRNRVLYRVVATPTGTPLSYANPSIATSTIATSVANDSATPIFRYFDNTSVELPSPTNIAKIASVQTTVVVDVNSNRAPVAFTLSGGATLRNLKDQP